MSEYTWPDGFRELVKTHEAQIAERDVRIHSLEAQLAAERAKWAELRAWCEGEQRRVEAVNPRRSAIIALHDVLDAMDRVKEKP